MGKHEAVLWIEPWYALHANSDMNSLSAVCYIIFHVEFEFQKDVKFFIFCLFFPISKCCIKAE